MSSQTPNQTMQARFAGFTDDFPDFSYGAPANDAAGLRLSVSVFADRGHLRDEMGRMPPARAFVWPIRADCIMCWKAPPSRWAMWC